MQLLNGKFLKQLKKLIYFCLIQNVRPKIDIYGQIGIKKYMNVLVYDILYDSKLSNN